MRMFMMVLAAAGVTLGTGAVAQDVESGKAVFRKCAACHDHEKGVNKLGPTLKGVFGRKAGTVEGFKYSPKMQESGLVWDEANLTEFLHDPKKKVPGTRMIFPGIKDDAEIENLIAYLKSDQ
ncbi:MAG TPA: cytochrome c family protein [Hyphomicrobium sp.]|nr:cytochrome c family protein [Hyphomicrobium sp.]